MAVYQSSVVLSPQDYAHLGVTADDYAKQLMAQQFTELLARTITSTEVEVYDRQALPGKTEAVEYFGQLAAKQS
ncbi:hypothetical protein MK904_01795 [Loigolactobacillus coryniformis]|jgi:hypothetical protein|uniref:Uncharacterized protein n=2 Tax=Loigolactobacillus coryniformis TaxID=1610 RepID=A0A0R1FHS1_9LACO|nr:hypothetical protein [Loigolactobacillus coryniformis]OEH90850.1 hypothetical protein ATO00_01265 [Loigolactobacillus coryniformis subsp. coryniformis]RRG04120.1 MAG: hypothetical protein DUD28_09085 [Lactobacillus sp.]ATO54401.1 hypothetical protein LC20001_01600 [Loigolactobacillus coryniformis subsp. coryniformis KCTC 3167 = DSM 20001]KRK18786.1 hypothetical protein FD22_GL002341 [Loigolactobacillus coryniformis subsp. coryniformis KCTC 3167 = DSM 20001]MBW4801464.1 hypothetical protein 